MSALHLFALNTPQTASEVCAHLGIAPAPCEWRPFERGEHKIRPLQSVRDGDVYLWHSLYGEPGDSVNDRLCRTWFLCGALHDHGAARITLVAPYLPYARKDRRTQTFDPVTTRYLARLCEAAGFDRVLTLDVHNPAAYENAFRIPAYDLKARTLLADAVAARFDNGDAPVVLSPDAGGAKRAEAFRQDLSQRLRRELDFGQMEKYRGGGRITGSRLFAEVDGRSVVIVDDLVAGGDTLTRTARAAMEAGARRVLAVATHGMFADGAARNLADAPLECLFVTDSIDDGGSVRELLGERLRIVSTARRWADAIGRLHHGQAFDDNTDV